MQKENGGKIWLKREMRPYGGRIVFLALITVFSTLFSLAFAYLTGEFINGAATQERELVFILAGVLLGLLLLKIASNIAYSYASEKLRGEMVARTRVNTYSKILRAEYSKVHAYHSGELLNRLTSDIQEVVSSTVWLLPSIIGMCLQCLGAIAALLTIDWRFTLIYVLCGGVMAGIATLFRRSIKKRHKELLAADGELRSYMQEGVLAMPTVKAYGVEEKSKIRAGELALSYYEKRQNKNRLQTVTGGVFSLLTNFGLIFAIVWCGVSVLNGSSNYGAIVSVLLLLMQLQRPLSSFSSILPIYYGRQASAERLNELYEIPDEIVDNPETGDEKIADMQAITMQNVSFDYGREKVLTDVNFTLKTGEIACITGASGAGKSTLFKLLLQVYKQTQGQILLQTGNTDNMPLGVAHRKLFAYVPQGNFLFSGTIYENLTTFMPNADTDDVENRIREALHVACAQFVYELPDGLQTRLLEEGDGLSEGQRQRLAIARAILSERPVLLLDEATSALDTETEKQLLQNIRALKDKTCFIVTHRAAAKEIADKVYRLKDGVLSEE